MTDWHRDRICASLRLIVRQFSCVIYLQVVFNRLAHVWFIHVNEPFISVCWRILLASNPCRYIEINLFCNDLVHSFIKRTTWYSLQYLYLQYLRIADRNFVTVMLWKWQAWSCRVWSLGLETQILESRSWSWTSWVFVFVSNLEVLVWVSSNQVLNPSLEKNETFFVQCDDWKSRIDIVQQQQPCVEQNAN